MGMVAMISYGNFGFLLKLVNALPTLKGVKTKNMFDDVASLN